MYFRRIIVFLVVLLLAVVPVVAQEDETTTVDFEEGSSIVLPPGWEIVFEPDAYGNFTTSRSDGFSANFSFIPLASLPEAFAELDIDPDNALDELLELYIEANGLSLDDGELERVSFDDVSVLVFTTQTEENLGRIYVGQFPNGQLLMIWMGFDADVSLDDEAVQQVFADVEFIYNNVQPAVADDSGDMSGESEGWRLSTSWGVSFVPPAEWELTDEYESDFAYTASFENAMDSISVEIPIMAPLEEGMEEMGIGYDELAATVFANNRSSDFDEIEFDADTIVSSVFDEGTFEFYFVENENGEAELMFMVLFKNENVVLIKIYGTSDTVNDYHGTIMVMLNTFEFGEAPEASADDGDEEASDSDISLLTLGDGTAFSVPDGWFVDNISDQNRIYMLIGDDLEALVDLPSLADIEQGLEGLGVDLESLPPVLIELQTSSYELEFDASAIETMDVERGTLYTYSDLDDEGTYVAWYVMIYDDGHVGGVEYSSYEELAPELAITAIDLLNSVEFPD